MKPRAAWVVLAVVLSASCDLIVAPGAESFQPTVTLSVESTFADLLDGVDGAHLRITPPGASQRDTTLRPRRGPEGMRMQAVLRPDEGQLGTEVEVSLTTGRTVVFRGSTVFGTEEGWPRMARLPIHPVATLEVGEDRSIPRGGALSLDDMRPILLPDGEARSSDFVSWISSDPEVVEITDGRAWGRAEGSVHITAIWKGQADSFSLYVAPAGTIVLSESRGTYEVVPPTVVLDTVSVESGDVGDADRLQAIVTSGESWLSATLTAVTTPSQLIVEIDGASLPEEGSSGRVIVRSQDDGVVEGVFDVEAVWVDPRRVETRVWSPYCIFGDAVSWAPSGEVACIDLRARAWTSGDHRRVTLEVRNLLGGLDGSYDQPSEFDLRGFGFYADSVELDAELLEVGTTGDVRIVGEPSFPQVVLPGLFQVSAPWPESVIVGCAPPREAPNYFQTCDDLGFTGSVRAEFQVADTTWSLDDTRATMDMLIWGRDVSNCFEGTESCYVME